RFCHDPKFPLTPEEGKMCRFVVSSDTTCPAFAEVCKPGAGATRVPPPKKRDVRLPSLMEVPRAFLLGLLVLAVAVVVYLVVRNIRSGPAQPDLPDEAEEAAPAAQVTTPMEVETDVDRLLNRARAAAAAGDYARAIMDLHGALLRRLE